MIGGREMAKVLQGKNRTIISIDVESMEKDRGELTGIRKNIQEIFELSVVGRMYLDMNDYDRRTQEVYIQKLDAFIKQKVSFVELRIFADSLEKPLDKSNIEEVLWEHLNDLKEMAKERSITIIPVIHGYYVDRIYDEITGRGYITYDLFFNGLLQEAIYKQRVEILALWVQEIIDEGFHPIIRMKKREELGFNELKGMVPDEDIEALNRNRPKASKTNEVFGMKNQQLLFCRAIQIFMPGIVQIGIDEFVEKDGMETRREQMQLIQLRNTHIAFHPDSEIKIEVPRKDCLIITRAYKGGKCRLEADFKRLAYGIYREA